MPVTPAAFWEVPGAAGLRWPTSPPGASGTRSGLAGSGVNFPRRAAALRVWVRKPRDSLPQSFGDKVPQVAPAENSAHTPASSGGRRYRGAPRRSGKLDVAVRPVPGARGGFWNPTLAMGPSSRLDRSLRPLAARPFFRPGVEHRSRGRSACLRLWPGPFPSPLVLLGERLCRHLWLPQAFPGTRPRPPHHTSHPPHRPGWSNGSFMNK